MSESLGPAIARERLWWARHGMTDEYQDLVAYESEVARTSTYQPLLVPGILQTRRYAVAATAAILRRSPDDRDVAARADVRVERSRIAAARAGALQVVAIVEESALRRVIGDDGVMREQLDNLVVQARLPHVTLVILPAALGGHAGLCGGFELIETADEPELAAVFIESAAGDQLYRDPRATAYYRQVVGDLVTAGVGGDEAIALLLSIRDALGDDR